MLRIYINKKALWQQVDLSTDKRYIEVWKLLGHDLNETRFYKDKTFRLILHDYMNISENNIVKHDTISKININI